MTLKWRKEFQKVEVRWNCREIKQACLGSWFGVVVFFRFPPQFWRAGGFYRLRILTLTQHLQAPACVNEEGTMTDLGELKGWEE